jgi:hypothetical protein
MKIVGYTHARVLLLHRHLLPPPSSTFRERTGEEAAVSYFKMSLLFQLSLGESKVIRAVRTTGVPRDILTGRLQNASRNLCRLSRIVRCHAVTVSTSCTDLTGPVDTHYNIITSRQQHYHTDLTTRRNEGQYSYKQIHNSLRRNKLGRPT